MAYNKENLEQLVSGFDNASQIRQGLTEDPYNPDSRTESEGYIKWYLAEAANKEKDPEKKAQLQELATGANAVNFAGAQPDVVRKYADSVAKSTGRDLVDCVAPNYQAMLNELKAEELMSLVLSMPPYETGNHGHDEVARLQSMYMKSDRNLQAAAEGDRKASDTIAEEISEILKADALGEAIAYNIRADPQFRLRFYNGVVRAREGRFGEAIKGKDKGYLVDYIVANTAKAKDGEKVSNYITAAKVVATPEAERSKLLGKA